jgi:7-cyano-7-deazaguanine synthase
MVLLSGGLDSAVALFWALDQGHEVETLTFGYFQRSKREIQACKRIARRAGCPNRVVRLPFLKEIEDWKNESKNPDLFSAGSAYIPCRNIVFYGIAASFAEILNCATIVGGHNRNDAEAYPDASIRFFNHFNRTASLGRVTGSKTGRVILPLAGMDKSEVVRLGAKLGVPFELTWSCYGNGKEPCGHCMSCTLRRKAFSEAGIQDPIEDK